MAKTIAAPALDVDPEREAATKAQVLHAAERLFALNGFQNVSVRDITAAAGVNLASVNYHFGSKDALLFEIFRRRTAELNRDRARMLHEASDRHGGKPPVREILRALFEPPLRWSDPGERPAHLESNSSYERAARAPRPCARCCAPTSRTCAASPTPCWPPAPTCRRRTSTGGCTSAWG